MKKAIICTMAIVVLMFAMTGCITINMPDTGGAGQGGQTETTEPEPEPEPTPEPEEFNLADGLKMTEEGPEKIIDTDYFTLKLGAGDTWIYEIDNDRSISLYNIISRDSKKGGLLCSITAYDEGDTSYEDLPSFTEAGQAGGKTIVVIYPTDVQFDTNNAQAAEEYKVVFQQLEKIRDGGGESPLQLK